MSDWNPKEEWRRLKLVTEAVYLFEVGADYDAGYADEEGESKVDKEEEKKKKQAAYDALPKVEKWGDLHDIINAISHAKELQALSDKGGQTGKAAATIIGYLPGGGAFMNWAQTPAKVVKAKTQFKDDIKSIMGTVKTLKDEEVEKPSSGFLDAFKIDDGYQKITDDRLENKFIKDIADEFGSKPRDEAIPPDLDINDWYESWLSDNIGDTDETVTGAEEDTKFTDIAKIDDKAKKSDMKKSVDRVTKALGGTLKGFLGF